MINDKMVVAMCTSRINEPNMESLIESLSRGLWQINAKLFVYCTCRDLFWRDVADTGEATVYDLLDFSIVDALIICTENVKDEALQDRLISRARKNNVPVITVDSPIEGCVNIGFDQAGGIGQITRHLIEEHGIRDFHFMAGIRGNMQSNERLKSFKRILDEYEIPFTNDMISFGDFWEVPATAAVQKLIDEKKVPKAIVCANDMMAIAAADTLMHNGYRVPEDVAVTGYDGIEETHFSNPTITSCECRYEDVSEHICNILSDIIDGFIANRDYIIPLQPMYGHSCGCESKRNVDMAKYVKYYRNRYCQSRDYEQYVAVLPSKAMAANNLKELAECFDDEMVNDVCCFLTKECTDVSFSPESNSLGNVFEDGVTLLFDADTKKRSESAFTPKPFDMKDIVPNFEDKFEDEFPIIFYAINVKDFPLGFVSFHFNESDDRNYVRIPLIISEINHAVAHYRGKKYCEYLENKIKNMEG